jgi:hypothetical protein
MKKCSDVMVNKSYFVGLFLLAIFFFTISGGPKSSLAADYYVDNTCAYNGNGTNQICAGGPGQQGPFNSMANAQAKVTGSHPDDRLLFKAGQTFTGLFTVGAYGTPGHPFTVSSYGAGAKPVFDGGGSAGYPTWGVINIINLSDITLDGLAVTNGGNQGIWIYRSDASSPTSGIIVKNCSCYNNPGYGLCYFNEQGLARPDLSDSAFYDNDCYQNASGIYVHRVNNLSIYHNTCRDNLLNGRENYGIGVEGGSGLKIYENIIANNWTNGIGIYGDNGADGPSDYCQVYRNVIYGTKYNIWAKDITWQGQVGSNSAIYYNILYSTDSHVQHFEDDTASSTGNVFYGNVLANGRYGVLTSGASWDIRNNIFYKITTPVGSSSHLTFSNNIAYPASTGVVNAIVRDPMFANPSGDWTGYMLQSTSPAINAGANLGSPYNLALDPNDLVWPLTAADQNTYGTGWEIGAFVYGSTATPLPPPTGLRVLE